MILRFRAELGIVGVIVVALTTIAVASGTDIAAAESTYALPWDAGDSSVAEDGFWKVTQGRHQGNAWDFQPPGAGSHNSEVLAVADGLAKLACIGTTGQATVTLDVAGTTWKYVHLQLSAVQSAGIPEDGIPVRRGQVLGRLFPSTSGASDIICGTLNGGSHLHLVLPTVPMTIDGYSFSSSSPATPLRSSNVRYAPSRTLGNFDGVGGDDVLLRRDNDWFLDLGANGTADRSYSFARASDQVYVGNFDGVGGDDVLLRRDNDWFLDLGANGTADRSYSFARASDQIISRW